MCCSAWAPRATVVEYMTPNTRQGNKKGRLNFPSKNIQAARLGLRYNMRKALCPPGAKPRRLRVILLTAPVVSRKLIQLFRGHTCSIWPRNSGIYTRRRFLCFNILTVLCFNRARAHSLRAHQQEYAREVLDAERRHVRPFTGVQSITVSI